jgi:hypothetical protein
MILVLILFFWIVGISSASLLPIKKPYNYDSNTIFQIQEPLGV